jgi:hypothetical protein
MEQALLNQGYQMFGVESFKSYRKCFNSDLTLLFDFKKGHDLINVSLALIGGYKYTAINEYVATFTNYSANHEKLIQGLEKAIIDMFKLKCELEGLN